MVALQRDQEVLEVKPQVPEERVTVVRALLLIPGEIPCCKKHFLRDGDLRPYVRVVEDDEISVQIIGVRDGFDGVDVCEQRLHNLSLKVSGLSHELLVVGDNAYSGLDNLHCTFIHNGSIPILNLLQYFSGQTSLRFEYVPSSRIPPVSRFSSPAPR